MNRSKNELIALEIDSLSYNRSNLYDAISNIDISNVSHDKKRKNINCEILEINKRIDNLIGRIKDK